MRYIGIVRRGLRLPRSGGSRQGLDGDSPRIRPSAAAGAVGGGEKGARAGNSAVAVHTASDHVVHFRAKDGTRPGGKGGGGTVPAISAELFSGMICFRE